MVAAFNSGMPYDEFIRRQIAGDVLYPDDFDALVATGLLVAGTWDQVGHREGTRAMQAVAREEQLEDLVGMLSQTFLGLTVDCARCHDHKFDPVTQREYFQFAALLGGVHQDEEERSGIALSPQQDPEARAAVEALTRFEEELRGRDEASGTAGLLWMWDQQRGNVTGPRLSESDGGFLASDSAPAELVAAAKATGAVTLHVWATPVSTDDTGPARILTLSRDSSARNFTVGQDMDRWVVRFRHEKTDGNGLPALEAPGVEPGRRVHLAYSHHDREGKARLWIDGQLAAEGEARGGLGNWDDSFLLAIGNELTGDRPWSGTVHAAAVLAGAEGDETVRARAQEGPDSLKPPVALKQVLADASAEDRQRHADLAARVADLDPQSRLAASDNGATFDGSAHVPVLRQPQVFRILARGEPSSPGDEVVPAAPGAPAGLDGDLELARDAPEGERRRRLADWIADPANPLTPRVMVNRVWHYHFGIGLVDTPSDFGFQGNPPSHPELLEWLAASFVESGWDIQHLHRLIIGSATYRQRSDLAPEAALARDADNRLLWRGPRRQLEGEAVRDSVLAVSGLLNRQLGGPSFHDVATERRGRDDIFKEPVNDFRPDNLRRSIYRLWARSGNHPLLLALDCPDPSVAVPRRARTITPLQALGLLHNPLLEHAAEAFASRLTDAMPGAGGIELAATAWREALGREPTREELSLAESFLNDHGLEQLCLVLFNHVDFLVVE